MGHKEYVQNFGTENFLKTSTSDTERNGSIILDLKERSCVDAIGLGLLPITDFAISGVEPSDSATSTLVN
jgi:hypothetical protein